MAQIKVKPRCTGFTLSKKVISPVREVSSILDAMNERFQTMVRDSDKALTRELMEAFAECRSGKKEPSEKDKAHAQKN